MITGVIQAGGRSSRMGEDKGVVLLAGRPLVEHVLQRLQQVTDNIIIVTNNPTPYRFLNIQLIGDEIPGQGALSGLITALEASQTKIVALAGVDLPFMSPQVFHDLIARLERDVPLVLPEAAGRWQPFHAVYRPALCLPVLRERFMAGEQGVIAALARLNPIVVDYNAAPEPFFNINTPEDLHRAQRTISE